MSAIETALEKVRNLDEARVRQLLAWLDAQAPQEPRRIASLGAVAMLGYARRFRSQPRTTDEWITELRAGESD